MKVKTHLLHFNTVIINIQESVLEILLELDKAKLVISADRLNGCRLLNPPTKTQKDILEALALSIDSFMDTKLVC